MDLTTRYSNRHNTVYGVIRNCLLVLPALGGLLFPLISLAQTEVANKQWPLCPGGFDVPSRPVITETLLPGETFVAADQADFTEGGMSHLTGNAEVVRDQQHMSADRIDYNQEDDNAYLEGNVQYWDDDIYMNSINGHIDLEQDTGLFNDVEFRIPSTRGRGHADQAYVESGDKTDVKRVDYTTCDPETGSPWNLTNNIWKINARNLRLDHQKDTGTAKHVILKIKDIPVFYTPYISFPISDKRKSGFLAPSYGSSSRNGTEIQTPYYWNIAPQMDATLTPRILTDSGVMLMGEYRYLFNRGQGNLNIEYLPSDDVFNGRDRSFVSFDHRQSFLSSGSLSLLYNRVSDKNYLEDFGSTQLATSSQFLERFATASYGWNLGGHSLSLRTLVQDFQTVDRTLAATSRPYKRLPSTYITYYSPSGRNQLQYTVRGEMDYFTRGEDNALNNVNGFRYDLFPSVSIPFTTTATYLTPKVGVRFTRYQLNDNTLFADAPDRILPVISLDSGIFLERNTTLFGESVLQTLEPRLFYLYVPAENQSDLPVFDTGLFDTSFSSLFFEDRFSGPDRMEDANRITLAVTSRLYSETSGGQLGFFSIGQIFHLRDRRVVLPGQPVQTDTLSSVVSEFGTTIFRNLDLRGEVQWNPNDQKTEKMSVTAQYRPGEGKVINLGYRVRRPGPGVSIISDVLDIEQTDFSFRWPIKQNWSVVGKWNYALPEGRSLDLFGGIEYNSCCWGVRAVARRFLSNLDGDFQTGIFLQFELKGLAGIGQKTVDFLTQGIPGYETGF